MVDGVAAINLRHRGNDQRSKGETQHKHTDDEGGGQVVVVIELGL